MTNSVVDKNCSLENRKSRLFLVKNGRQFKRYNILVGWICVDISFFFLDFLIYIHDKTTFPHLSLTKDETFALYFVNLCT